MNKLIGVLSLIGTVISVATFAFDLRGRPIATLGPGVRFAIAVVLAVIGIWSWRTAPPEASAHPPTTASASPATASAEPVAAASIPPARSSTAEPRSGRSTQPARSAIMFREQEDDELTIFVGRVLGAQPFRGTLERTCTQDDAMEGMITCRLTMHLRIGDEAAFSVDARGGGFTERAAEQQARQRLLPLLETKIRTWRENR
ncbi:MAG TPA: hypothetical protein VEK79_05275 [Thermoanaerobaculia bacterium]|nr:hypothetical protein [Thermoanaerobaculia bacterium]